MKDKCMFCGKEAMFCISRYEKPLRKLCIECMACYMEQYLLDFEEK